MLASKITTAIDRYRMVCAFDRIAVGLSGGADSVALTELLVELQPKLRISLVLAHLNHGLRTDADDDEAFCREIARRHSLPFVSRRVDVAAAARKNRRSIEDEGRRSRYRFLESQADRFDCQRIAVGHTLDDQAETFLLRLFRGSGGRGLGAVHPVVEGKLIRPLIELRRSEIESFLKERGVDYREDPTNADPRFTRNRIRHMELPRLVATYNPRLVETLARSASLLRDEEEWMEAETQNAYRALASESGGGIRLPATALGRQPRALRRRLVRLAIERLRGSLADVGLVHVEDVLALVERGQSGREVHLPGLVARLSFDEIRLHLSTDPRRKGLERGYNGFEYRLTIPARVRIPEGGGVLLARISTPAGKPDPTGRPEELEIRCAPFGNSVIVGFEGQLPELKVRSPRPGDRFHPLGAPGSKSLTRYLMERKVEREVRSRIPLLVRGRADDTGNRPGRSEEEILWVVGHGVSEASRATAGRRRLRFRWVMP